MPSLPIVPVACVCFLATALTGQIGRIMSMPTPPVAGQSAVFKMTHNPAAAGRINLFVLSLPTPQAVAIPIPGFSVSGLVRIDPLGLLADHVTVLDASGITSWTLPIPNVPTAAGFAFDVQTIDIDFVTNDAAWANNDIAAVVAPPPPRLVINEIDYDQPNVDNASFIEIFNAGPGPASLANIEVRLVNGANSQQYASFALATAAASLAPNAYLVIGNGTITQSLPGSVPSINVLGDFIQNGSPDGVVLVDTATGVVLDALSYEGSIGAAVLTGFSTTIDLVEGAPFTGADSSTATQSLVRVPNGIDTNNAATDWALAPLPTPGAAN
ncbi:MAG: lamin tail domain-containing protein [Planctomycetes bacterium]|nr:lamin tail domain-containing protein [Planctomycetota bacterium]